MKVSFKDVRSFVDFFSIINENHITGFVSLSKTVVDTQVIVSVHKGISLSYSFTMRTATLTVLYNSNRKSISSAY